MSAAIWAAQTPGIDWQCSAMHNGVFCDAGMLIANDVDDTNGESSGYRLPIQITPAETQTCNLGHDHVVNSPTYRLDPQPRYWDGDSWLPARAKSPTQL